MAAALTAVQGLQSGGSALFKSSGRYFPNVTQLADTQKPGCYLIRGNEVRYKAGQFDTAEGLVSVFPLGVILVGSETDKDDLDAELIELEATIEELLTENSLGGLCFKLIWIRTDTPQANASLPVGTVMPMYAVQYSHGLGDPEQSS